MEKEKEDLQTKDCSLSIDSWMTVLNSEINRNEDIQSHIVSSSLIILSIIIVLILGYITFLMDLLTILMEPEFASTNLTALTEGAELWIKALWIISLFYLIIAGIFTGVTRGKIKILDDIRNYTIAEKSPNLKKICGRWEQYRNAKLLYFLFYPLKKQ